MSMSGIAVMRERRRKVEELLGLHKPKAARTRGASKTATYVYNYGRAVEDEISAWEREYKCFAKADTEHRGGTVKRGKTKWERK